jgi:Na+-translocating ferredoxin:NAD+ oxidoreductase subunit B
VTPRAPDSPAVAFVDESRCIGCTLCILACPYDAIVGAAKLMHTVIAEACTGCELCVPRCPVDCIALLPSPYQDVGVRRALEDAARYRFDARNARLARLEEEQRARATERRERDLERQKRKTISNVMEKARQRLAARGSYGKPGTDD